ncbi:cysteine synthase A [Acidobacteriota bacterium]
MKVKHLHDLIGRTPLVSLNRIVEPGCSAVYVKLEFFNPGGSVKDRIALSMIEDAEKKGELRPGMIIVEGTSGNTGIGLAFVAASKGYETILFMPDTMSKERRALLSAFGAKVVLTPGPEGMKGTVDRADALAAEDPEKYWVPRQFDNPANPQVHRRTTAMEILEDCPEIDALVAGVGTGGTVTGTGEVLKQKKPEVKVYAVEPMDSPLLTGGLAGPHKIQGIGANFIPSILNTGIYDRVFDVTYEDAAKITRRLAREEGILVGVSSGAIAWSALEVAGELGEGKTVVAILADNGERYLSTPLFEST